LSQGVSVTLVTPAPVQLRSELQRFSDAPKGVEPLLQQKVWGNTPPQALRIIDGHFEERWLPLLQDLDHSTGFNLGQYEAQHAPLEADVELSAGAGTGKTQTMTARVLFLLHQGVPPDTLALLTFTREATRNMRERLAAALTWRLRLTGQQRYLRWLSELPRMQISTIHSFARVLLARFGAAIGHAPTLRIRSWRYERRRIIEQRLSAQLNLQENIAQQLAGRAFHEFVQLAERFADQLENEGLSVQDIHRLDWGTHGPELSANLQRLLSDAQSDLEKRKAEAGAAGLSDLTRDARQAARILAQRRQLDSGFRYLFVDEFQDTDDTQIDLIATLATAGAGARLFAGAVNKKSVRILKATAKPVPEGRARRGTLSA
jgi:DNA helicase-2/ATP-dependent DNA helicase PcrA